LEKKNISDWPKSGPVETGPTGPVATPLSTLCFFVSAICRMPGRATGPYKMIQF